MANVTCALETGIETAPSNERIISRRTWGALHSDEDFMARTPEKMKQPGAHAAPDRGKKGCGPYWHYITHLEYISCGNNRGQGHKGSFSIRKRRRGAHLP